MLRNATHGRGATGAGALAIVLLAAGCAPAVPARDAAPTSTAASAPGQTTTLPVLPTTVPESTTTSTTLLVGESLRIVHVTQDRSSVLPPFDARVEFPIVEGEIAAPGAIAAANALIEDHVATVTDPAIELLEAVGAPVGSGAPSEYAFTYEVAYASERLLSIRFFEVSKITGSDVQRQGISTLLLDLRSGVAYGLDDLVVSGDTKPAVTQLAAILVQAKYFEGEAAAEFGPYEERIASEGVTHVLLVEEGLEVWFDELTAGPAELGTPTVTIPFAELEGVLDPATAAGEFLSTDQ